MTKRVISFILTFAMLLAIVPPIRSSADDGDYPVIKLWDHELDGNQFTMTAEITTSGGGILLYGFAYTINNATEPTYEITYKSIDKYEPFSHTITVNPGDSIWYEAIVKNEFGLETKVAGGFIVPEPEPEIELDAPDITSPDVDGLFYAGEDIEFRWTAVLAADQYEWELYKLNQDGKYAKIDSGYTNKPVTIDGDTFKSGCSYKFQIRSCCGNAVSEWRSISLYIHTSPEFSANPNSLVLPSNEGEAYFDLKSSYEWEADVSVNWIDLSSYDGVGDEEITVYVDKNIGEHRTGIITITNEVGDSIMITVQQDKGVKAYMNVNPSEMSVSWEENYYYFSVESNVISWQVYSDYDWIDSLSNSLFDNNVSIKFSVDENKSTLPRTGTITVTGGGITRTVTVIQEGRTAEVGDINNDGEITNKDRLWLNRYLASMVGYESINKRLADINGDGNVTQEDASILGRHLSGWIGYENLESFYKVSTPPINNVPKWDMSFSSNAVTIELELKEGSLDTSRKHLFIAENSKGLHYTGIIEAGKTSASFSVKAMQMPRGEMYSFYIIPEGIALAGNEDTYCIGKSVVPLFNGNMITSVKSGGRSIAKNGNVFLGDAVTINWDGSFGVDNFKLVVTLNGSEIYSQTFDHDGPGTVTISADKITANGVGTLIISGYVQPSAASGLATAVSVWSGNVVKYEISPDDQNNSIDWLNEDARALYNKNEELAYLQLDTYYYWQAFVDELTGFKHWGSALQHVRTYISNYINSVFSTPSLNLDTQGHALLKQAIRTKLVEMMKADSNLDENHWQSFSNTQEAVLDGAMREISNIDNGNDAIQPIMKSMALSADAQEKIIKSIADSFDFSTFNGFKDPNALISKIVTKFSNHSIDYEGKTYKLTDFFNLNENTALQIKVKLQSIKKAKKATDISNAIGDAKKTYAVVAEKLDKASGVIGDILLGAELAGRFMVHADDMIALVNLHYKFDEYEKMLQNMVQSSDGLFQACIVEVMDELRGSAVKLVLAESATDLGKLVVDKLYDKLVGDAISSLHPYVKLAKISNDIITGLADTDSINKGELTLPYILDAMNNTISKISYNYSMFMTNPSNELYYELEALFITYKFQVELGAEVYLNLCTVDHNSHLKRFYRFVNPFDKDDKMPEEFQACYKQDITKLNYVLNWFGFN